MSDEINESVVTEEVAAPAEPELTMDEILRDPSAPVLTMRKCLEAGVHFGHQTRRWNPKMQRYIHGSRNGIYIINLAATVETATVAYEALKSIAAAGGKILFVGTKPQSQQIVIDEAVRSGSFYITNRWLGGTLTNFRTITARIKRLRELDVASTDGSWETLPKKEVALLKKEHAKLTKNLGGISEMRKPPQAIVLVDPTVEHNAVAEARKSRIPVFALCDTSDDPELIDYPIPTNNDATSAIKLIIGLLADAVLEGRAPGSLTEVAHVKDKEKEATMEEAVKVADIAAEQHRAAIRAARKAREERYAKMQAERQARHAARRAAAEAKPAEKPAEEKPAEEKKDTVETGEGE